MALTTQPQTRAARCRRRMAPPPSWIRSAKSPVTDLKTKKIALLRLLSGLKPVTSVMGSMRFVRSYFAQSLGVVIAWRGIRDRPGLVDSAGVFGVSYARGCDAVTVVIVALAAEVVSAGPMVTGRLAGMIAGQPLAMAAAGGIARVVRTCTTATHTCTIAPTVSTAITATVSTTTFFCGSRTDEREISRKKWSCGQHQGAGHDSDEALGF